MKRAPFREEQIIGALNEDACILDGAMAVNPRMTSSLTVGNGFQDHIER
jgi:hypothetical protein